MQTQTRTQSSTLTNFRITRAYEADYAQYADQSNAAAALVFKQYDVVATAVAAGRTDEALILAALLEDA